MVPSLGHFPQFIRSLFFPFKLSAQKKGEKQELDPYHLEVFIASRIFNATSRKSSFYG